MWGQLTPVVTVWLMLLLATGSEEEALTVAMFSMVLCTQFWTIGTLKAIWTVLLWPAFRLKLLQRTLVCEPLRTQLLLERPVLNVVPAGMTSEMTTFVATSGPKFVAVTV